MQPSSDFFFLLNQATDWKNKPSEEDGWMDVFYVKT